MNILLTITSRALSISLIHTHTHTHMHETSPHPPAQHIVVVVAFGVVVAFSSRARISGEYSTIHSLPALFCCCFFKVEINSCKLIPLFRPGSVRSGLASWDDWLSVHWQVASELVSRSVPTLCLDSDIISPLRLHWVKGVCVFRRNLPSALLEG